MTDVGLSQWRESYAAALAASEGLRAALARLGVPEHSYRSIRPATTSTGKPYVYLGVLNAGAVEAITAVLLHGLVEPGLPNDQGADATVRPTRQAHPTDATHPSTPTPSRDERPEPAER